MSLEGLKLGALFSCKTEINDLLHANIDGKELQKELERLPNYAWYGLIASALQVSDVFAERVVHAYWLGNEEIKEIVLGQKTILVFHNFIILERVEGVSIGTIAPNAKSVDDCKISLGFVQSTNGGMIDTEYDALFFENGKYYFRKQNNKKIKKGFLEDVKRGDWIAFHLGVGRKKLTKEEASLLRQKTIDAVRLFNGTSR